MANRIMVSGLVFAHPDQRCIVARLDEQMVHANNLIRALESERGAIVALPVALLREVFE